MDVPPPGHKTAKSPINPRKTNPRGVNGEIVSEVSEVSEGPPSPGLESEEGATLKQLERIRKLVEEGMSETLAREELLGKGQDHEPNQAGASHGDPEAWEGRY